MLFSGGDCLLTECINRTVNHRSLLFLLFSSLFLSFPLCQFRFWMVSPFQTYFFSHIFFFRRLFRANRIQKARQQHPNRKTENEMMRESPIWMGFVLYVPYLPFMCVWKMKKRNIHNFSPLKEQKIYICQYILLWHPYHSNHPHIDTYESETKRTSKVWCRWSRWKKGWADLERITVRCVCEFW